MSGIENLLKQLAQPTEAEIEDAYYNRPNMAEIRAKEYMARYCDIEAEFENKTSLNKVDLSVLMVAAALQCLRWYLLSSDKMRFKDSVQSDRFFKDIAENEYVPASLGDIIKMHKVPYDVQNVSARFKAMYPHEAVKLHGYHRIKTLGHDPLAGLIFGTANIATNTLTVADISRGFPSYHVLNGEIYGMTDLYHIMKWSREIWYDKPEVMGIAFCRQIVHLGTDAFTPQGLPIPLAGSIMTPKYAKFIAGQHMDLYSVSRSVAFAMVINKVTAMFHRLFFKSAKDNESLYEVKTRKILIYSNIMASLINAAYVLKTNDTKRLDTGGILVALWRLLCDREKIAEIKEMFISKILHDEYTKELDESKRRLESLGGPVIF